MDEEEDRSFVSRAGIEDSDLDSDEADMILAGIYFGDDTEEASEETGTALTRQLPTPETDEAAGVNLAREVDGDCGDSREEVDDNVSINPSNSTGSRSTSALGTPSDSVFPSDIDEYEVLDVASSSSDGEYTRLMDAACRQSSSEDDDDDSDTNSLSDIEPGSIVSKAGQNSCAAPHIAMVHANRGLASEEDSSEEEQSDTERTKLARALSSLRGLEERPVFHDGLLVTTNNTDVKARDDLWCINSTDRMRSTAGGRSRYYTKKMVCSNCDGEGHGWKQCPKPKKKRPCVKCGLKDHPEWNCPDEICYRCMQPGHRARDCRRARGRGMYEQCERCLMRGHSAEFCSDLWRQYHHTTSSSADLTRGSSRPVKDLYCYNCARKGHLGHECTRERLNNFMPMLPFVAVYGKSHSAPSTPNRRIAHTPRHRHSMDDGTFGKMKKRKSFASRGEDSFTQRRTSHHESASTASQNGVKNQHKWFDDDLSIEPAMDPHSSPPVDDRSFSKKSKKSKRKHHQSEAGESFTSENVAQFLATDISESTACDVGKKKKKKKKSKQGAEEPSLPPQTNNDLDHSWSSERQVFQPATASTPHHKQSHKKANKSFSGYEKKQNKSVRKSWSGDNNHQQQQHEQHHNRHDWSANRSPNKHWQGNNGGQWGPNQHQKNSKKKNRHRSFENAPEQPEQRHMNSDGTVTAAARGKKARASASRGFKMSAKGSRIVTGDN
eukprot:scpid48118/ scgid18450/ Zinc finger CCHC domain-containing protein 7